MRSGSTVWRAPVQPGDALDDDARGAGAGDVGAHLVEAVGDVADLGSRAAFSITVVPRASTAAIIAVWVPPTVTLGKSMSPPRRPFLARAMT